MRSPRLQSDASHHLGYDALLKLSETLKLDVYEAL